MQTKNNCDFWKKDLWLSLKPEKTKTIAAMRKIEFEEHIVVKLHM